ncbi:MAG: hypothetical protein M1827_002472 [Pycnora praestabilis]|nr:MAG: hypothetical protein M1827_002472 [Pycnora praestabilis]
MGETISEAISADHHALDEYYEKIKSAPDLETKIKWRNLLTWTLARHAISEELTMYPAMEKHMGQEGVELTNVDRQQHQAVKEDLHMIQGMSPDNHEFMYLLDRLMTDLHHHIEHEANEDMPRLEKLLSREESEALAKTFQRTKMFTPTRSHPSAPNRPYFENLAALTAAPIDRFMDYMRDFPEESKL